MSNKTINNNDTIKYDYLDDFNNYPERFLTEEECRESQKRIDDTFKRLQMDEKYQSEIEEAFKKFGY